MKTRLLVFLITVFAIVFGSNARASDTYFVSVGGSDDNCGSIDEPFATLQKAADVIKAGDTCYIRGGRYHQQVKVSSSATGCKPITFQAYGNERVTLDGTDTISGQWSVYKGNIYKIRINEQFDQLFVDDEMMIEARWPNMSFDERFDRSRWAKAGVGSQYGKLACDELKGSEVDWSGALAYLNIAHQWWTWTRSVTGFDSETGSFTYDKNIVGLCGFDEKQKEKWEDDYFYLTGKLGALDYPGEWFLDKEEGWLYLYCLDGESPQDKTVAYKKRTYGFYVEDADYIQLKGVDFFGTTFFFNGCNYCLAEDCKLLFPTYSRRITEFDADRRYSPSTQMLGNHNTIRKVLVAYSNCNGIKTKGDYNTVENCIIHDICWVGTLDYTGLKLVPEDETWYPEEVVKKGYKNTATHNTIYNSGNTLLWFNGRESTINYNHIYNGGLACKDVSLIYTARPMTSGSEICYNWVHDVSTDSFSGRGGFGGIGIRADQHSRDVDIHHNVVWNCGEVGILAKGEYNGIYNNTVFQTTGQFKGGIQILLFRRSELGIVLNTKCNNLSGIHDEYAKQWPLKAVSNCESFAINNAAYRIQKDRDEELDNLPEFQFSHNFGGEDMQLTDISNRMFTPLADSPLVDAGRIVPGITDGFKGSAPDIGAYEYGGERWEAGADWMDEYKVWLRCFQGG